MTSVDNNLEWLSKFIFFNTTRTHSIYHVQTNDELNTFGSQRNWGMALVDQGLVYDRYKSVIYLAHKASVVLAHDAEIYREDIYHYHEKAVMHYKYVCKFSIWQTRSKPGAKYISTFIMSNFIDITYLEQVFKQIRYQDKVVACNYHDY